MQLFTHLLSSYLQGMGDFFSALPREGRGGAYHKAAVFVPAPAGLFLPPTAAFFTVVTAGVMQRMTVGMAVTTRRKTCFPTVGTTGTTKAKPPAVPTAFCVYFSPSPKGGRSTQPPKTQQEWAPAPWVSPSPTLPKGRAFHPTPLNPARMDSRPLCKPLPNPPQGEGVPPNRLKHSRNGLPPLGEGRGGAFRRVRGGAYTSSGNSVGVAVPQPRVAGEARYPG